MITTIVAPSSPLSSPGHMVNNLIVLSLAKRSQTVSAPQIWAPGAGLSSLFTIHIPSGFTGISNDKLIEYIIAQLSVSCMVVYSLFHPSYHCTIIPHECSSPPAVSILSQVDQLVLQTFTSLQELKNRNRGSRWYALRITTCSSSVWTVA